MFLKSILGVAMIYDGMDAWDSGKTITSKTPSLGRKTFYFEDGKFQILAINQESANAQYEKIRRKKINHE